METEAETGWRAATSPGTDAWSPRKLEEAGGPSPGDSGQSPAQIFGATGHPQACSFPPDLPKPLQTCRSQEAPGSVQGLPCSDPQREEKDAVQCLSVREGVHGLRAGLRPARSCPTLSRVCRILPFSLSTIFLKHFNFIYLSWLYHEARGILVTRPRMEYPAPPEVEVQS